MHLQRLTPMLSVADLERTIAFYCNELGFQCVQKFGDPHPVWCYLKRDGVDLMFNQPPSAEITDLPRRAKDFQVYYFYPDDVAALHSAWKSKGLAVTDLRVTIYGMKEFELRDPQLLALVRTVHPRAGYRQGVRPWKSARSSAAGRCPICCSGRSSR